MRRINAAGLALVKRFEGCRLDAYLCPAGVPTVGWGSTRDVALGQSITQEQADEMLSRDLGWAELAVEQTVTVPLTDNQFSALVGARLQHRDRSVRWLDPADAAQRGRLRRCAGADAAVEQGQGQAGQGARQPTGG